MASDIPPSVYLNAAMRALVADPDVQIITAGAADNFAADPTLRAAVESVWEERGGHDDAAQGRRAGYGAAVEELRGVDSRTGSPAARWAAEYLGGQRRYVEARTADSAVAALDAQRPAEGGPEPATMSDADEAALLARQRDDVLARCAAREADGCTYIRIGDLYEAYLHDPADTPAALDSGQPATEETPAPKIHVTEAAGDKVYVVGRRQERNETLGEWIERAVRVIDVGPPPVRLPMCPACEIEHAPPMHYDAAPAPAPKEEPATEPATDRGTGRPCTIYVPPEYCSDPHRCRVHRGAYPQPATGETP